MEPSCLDRASHHAWDVLRSLAAAWSWLPLVAPGLPRRPSRKSKPGIVYPDELPASTELILIVEVQIPPDTPDSAWDDIEPDCYITRPAEG